MLSLIDKVLKLFKKKKPLFKHLQYIYLRKLWNEYGQGKNVIIAILDIPGDHGDSVIEIIRRIAPQATISFFSWVENGLTKISERLEMIYNFHPHVINISFVTGHTEKLESIIKKLYEAGVVLVAASGNNPKESYYPASYLDYVISVGSVYHKTGKVSPFTSKPFEVLAPGEAIKGIEGFGTSFAAPHITGIVACMLSKIKPGNIEAKIIEWLHQN